MKEILLDNTVSNIHNLLEDYFELDCEGYSEDLENVTEQIREILNKLLLDLNKEDHDWEALVKEKARLYNELAELREKLSEKSF